MYCVGGKPLASDGLYKYLLLGNLAARMSLVFLLLYCDRPNICTSVWCTQMPQPQESDDEEAAFIAAADQGSRAAAEAGARGAELEDAHGRLRAAIQEAVMAKAQASVQKGAGWKMCCADCFCVCVCIRFEFSPIHT